MFLIIQNSALVTSPLSSFHKSIQKDLKVKLSSVRDVNKVCNP